eukprot:226292_1
MSIGCEQLCGSFSSNKLCNAIAASDIATYLVIAISAIASIIGFILSITQVKSSEGMTDACKNNDVIELLSPFSLTGTMSSGTECFGYCSWSSNNTNLRFVSLSIFIILMIVMVFAMNKMKFIWLIRILLFITLTLLFTCLVEDFQSLISGKKACDNDFKIKAENSDVKILYLQCDKETVDIESCSIEPYIYMILSDIFTVIMCGVLWQLIGYYKILKNEVNRLNNNMLHEELDDTINTQNVIKNESEGGNIATNMQQQTTQRIAPMKSIEDY